MLKKTIPLGTFLGLEHTAHVSAFIGLALLWLLLGLAGRFLLDLPTGDAAAIALSATVLHSLSELWHQLGHARAANRAAAPMQGVHYWWVLASSVYPKEEPELSARVHIRRALGGPTASFFLAVVAGLLLLVLPTGTSPAYLLVAFIALDNLLIFTLGSLLPLGFTDGSTILKYWGAR